MKPRPRWSNPARWPRALTVSVIVVCVALIIGGVLAGIRLTRTEGQNPAQAMPSANVPAKGEVPTHAALPGCGDPPSLPLMSTRDKLAQLLMVGVTNASDAREVVANQHVGGIFIASWTDLSMLKDGSLTDIAAKAGPLHLAVSVDEEGGRVQRLTSLTEPLPSARVLARNHSPDQVYQLALQHGREIRSLGITIDFAPVVDVTDAPDDTVIGDRSFSADPVKVTQYAGAYAKGLRDAGVLPVVKHFPGHGKASGDSHATGVVTPPLSQLQDVDLVPYRTLLSQAPVGVMVGHMRVPDLTGNDQASLSKTAVDLLRNGIGYGGPQFDGPVFTDDLSTMRAITDQYGVAAAVLKALQAGADTALWVTNKEVPAVLDRLQAALSSGELSAANVDASVRRMAAAKALDSRCGH